MDKWNNVKFGNTEDGLTLLGVLVAIFVITTSMLAVSQLMFRSTRVAGISQEKFVAANLAREGLELAQAIRDTNWLDPTITAWTNGLCLSLDSRDPSLRLTIEPSDDTGTAGAITNMGAIGLATLYVTQNGEWTHQSTLATATPYHRILTIDCSQQAGGASDDEPGLIKISSQVTWLNRGQPQEIVVGESLYNWKRIKNQ